MKTLILIFALLISSNAKGQSQKISFISTDIENFWTAFDRINKANDTLEQYRILKEQYIDKGTAGLADLIQVRNYTPKEYIDAIRNYPNFWKSIRHNTTNVEKIFPQIRLELRKLEQLYPATKPATIYFAIGAFRTNGTVRGSNILIGSEAALADSQTKIGELPLWRQPFYTENNPIENVGPLIVHEYIHTLQNEMVHNLLSMCLYEGIAEFVSCKATGKPSKVPAIEFGKSHPDDVIELFVHDLFLMRNNDNWLWGQNNNRLRIRDLGYFIGYEMAERYYDLSPNKSLAIKELIELDYGNEQQIESLVDRVKLLPKPLAALHREFEQSRPKVILTDPAVHQNGQKLAPGKQKITIHFSEPLNGTSTGIDYGPLGKDHFPMIKPERIWSADKRSWTIEADLKPNMKYQFLIDNNFRLENGIPLKPLLVEFETGD